MREEERNGDLLTLDAAAMRAYLVDRLCDATIRPLRRASPAEMRERLAGPPPGEDFEALLGRDVLPFMSRGDRRRFPHAADDEHPEIGRQIRSVGLRRLDRHAR